MRTDDAGTAGTGPASPRPVAALLLGLATGALSGLFGVGGGIVIAPALVGVLHMGQRVAHGTSLTATVPIATAAAIGYVVAGNVDWAVAGLLAAGSVAGVLAGTGLLQRLSPKVLRLLFAVLLVVTAVRLLLAEPEATTTADLDLVTAGGLLVLGAAIGLLAGVLGVGGGIFMVPAMVLLFDVGDLVAKGTSLAVIVVTGVVGTVRNRATGTTDMRTALFVGAGGTVAALASAGFAQRLDPVVSSALFAALLLVVAARLAVSAVRGLRR